MTTPDDWGVWVNEVRINATRQGADWWFLFASRFERTPRMSCLDMCIAGALWHVACDTKQNACGSPGGYKRHRRLGEEPCRACLDAVAAYSREREALTKATRPKALCPVCGALRSLTAAGVMRRHGACAGSGERPLPTPAETEATP
jgi:hypothetical protein